MTVPSVVAGVAEDEDLPAAHAHPAAAVGGPHHVSGVAPDDDDHERSWFVYVVELPEGADREAVIRVLGPDGQAEARRVGSAPRDDRAQAGMQGQAATDQMRRSPVR